MRGIKKPEKIRQKKIPPYQGRIFENSSLLLFVVGSFLIG
jgi:hypothetical protein